MSHQVRTDEHSLQRGDDFPVRVQRGTVLALDALQKMKTFKLEPDWQLHKI